MQQIEASWKRIQEGAWQPEIAYRVQQVAHKLAGSSLTLGYIQIGMASRALENSFRDAAEHIVSIGEETGPGQMTSAGRRHTDLLALLGHYVDALRQAVGDRHREEIESLPDITMKMQHSRQNTRSRQVVYLVDDDPIQAEELKLQIGYFGYTVRTFMQMSGLYAALERETPAIILMDIILPEVEMSGIESILALKKKEAESPPVIFISTRTDMPARLQAVRAGGRAYFTKPVNIGKLIDAIDCLLKDSRTIPYRVLVVDDVAFTAYMTAYYLEEAGMETTIVTDPLTMIDVMTEFNPELILLDVYMPGCTGLELAEIIRQMDVFLSIPIVFLSAETDRHKQLHAIGIGGDDFLTKPIMPDCLVSAVTARVERYRQLRALMVRDSLTGTFNHSTVNDSLCQELARAVRQNTRLVFAMIDLDHFKLVNDTHGHAAGDRALRSLVHLLNKRLRNQDVVGRYGGDEFAVVFPNMTGPVALKILDEVREDFARILHQNLEDEFSVTFSCGIAEYPRFTTLGQVSEAADKALYRAKEMGRNQVVLAE